MSSGGIFEIREYLDSDGKIEKHDVVDISQELDFISKMCSAVGGEGTEHESELNEDEQFIRELAELSSAEEALDQRVDSASLAKETAASLRQPASQTEVSVPAPPAPAAKAKTQNAKASGGWSKGFLSSKKEPAPTKGLKQTDTIAAPSNLMGTQVAPPKSAAMGSGNASAPAMSEVGGTNPPTKAPAVEETHAFTGTVFERAAPPVAKLPPSTGTILGPKKR